MGLDMYLTGRRYFSSIDPKYDEVLSLIGLRKDDISGARLAAISVTLGYWRKANAIHGWFVENVQGGTDLCAEHYVSVEQLKELLDICHRVKLDRSLAMELLPPQQGFFFGGIEIDEGYWSDIDATIAMLENVLSPKHEECEFYYTSSW